MSNQQFPTTPEEVLQVKCERLQSANADLRKQVAKLKRDIASDIEWKVTMCEKCGHADSYDNFDCLGADPDKLFCNACNAEVTGFSMKEVFERIKENSDLQKRVEEKDQRIKELEQSFDELAEAVGWTKAECEQTGNSPMDTARSLRQRIHELEKQLKQSKAEHADMVTRNAFLRDRPDLPADRIPAYEKMVNRIKELEAEVASVKEVMYKVKLYLCNACIVKPIISFTCKNPDEMNCYANIIRKALSSPTGKALLAKVETANQLADILLDHPDFKFSQLEIDELDDILSAYRTACVGEGKE